MNEEGKNRNNRTLGAYGAPLEPRPFLPKKGNYRGLIVYKKAECIYDITFYFAHHYFVERKDRTIDQVVQAARSGKQNIAEGCSASSTSSETELEAEIAALKAENTALKARIAELEAQQKGGIQ